MTQTELKTSDHLDAAADYIEKHGLHKGDYFENYDETYDDRAHLWWGDMAREYAANGQTPRCCTLGALAITAAQAGFRNVDGPVNSASRVLVDAIGIDRWGLPDWNDKHTQRKDRVVKALRKAASLARKDGK